MGSYKQLRFLVDVTHNEQNAFLSQLFSFAKNSKFLKYNRSVSIERLIFLCKYDSVWLPHTLKLTSFSTGMTSSQLWII